MTAVYWENPWRSRGKTCDQVARGQLPGVWRQSAIVRLRGFIPAAPTDRDIVGPTDGRPGSGIRSGVPIAAEKKTNELSSRPRFHRVFLLETRL